MSKQLKSSDSFQHQAMTNSGLLSIRSLTQFGEICIKSQNFSNALENAVCNMVAILFRTQWVKWYNDERKIIYVNTQKVMYGKNTSPVDVLTIFIFQQYNPNTETN